MASSAWAVNPIRAQEKKPACEICLRAHKLQEQGDENPPKAARALADFMSTLKFSKDAKIRQQEMDALLAAAVFLAEKDERLEIQAYLWDFRKEEPKEYKAAYDKLSAADRKTVDREIAKVATVMETGREPEEPTAPEEK